MNIKGKEIRSAADYEAEIEELKQRNCELESHIMANARISMYEINKASDSKLRSVRVSDDLLDTISKMNETRKGY